MGQKVSRLGDAFGSKNANSSKNRGGAGDGPSNADVVVSDAANAVAVNQCDASTSGASDAAVIAKNSMTSSKGTKKSHWKLRFNSRPKSKSATKRRDPPPPPPEIEFDPPATLDAFQPLALEYEPAPPELPPSPSPSVLEPLDILPYEPSPTPSEIDSEPCICSLRYSLPLHHRSEIGVHFDESVVAEPLGGENREEEEPVPNNMNFHNTFDPFQSFHNHHSQLVLPSFDDGMMDLHSGFIGQEFMVDDFEDRAYKERAKEIQEGIEPPPGFRPGVHIQLLEFSLPKMTMDNLTTLFQRAAITAFNAPQDLNNAHRVHTSIDYIHYLVPDLLQITNCSCYWGKMDRYEAEKLLDNKPEGTFLLRDSAQEEYLFSVSFRKYGRSLHARIEQWNHLFSFDSRDPGVFASSTVCGLVEHYKDPTCCMFFEPMLTLPLHRNFTFSLQHACRATICSKITYDDINQLKLPKSMKSYLKEYHYKQRVRVRIFDDTEN